MPRRPAQTVSLLTASWFKSTRLHVITRFRDSTRPQPTPPSIPPSKKRRALSRVLLAHDDPATVGLHSVCFDPIESQIYNQAPWYIKCTQISPSPPMRGNACYIYEHTSRHLNGFLFLFSASTVGSNPETCRSPCRQWDKWTHSVVSGRGEGSVYGVSTRHASIWLMSPPPPPHIRAHSRLPARSRCS